MELYIFYSGHGSLSQARQNIGISFLYISRYRLQKHVGLLMPYQSICSPIVLSRKHANAVCS